MKLEDWRAQVEKELAGRSFDKSLVTETAERIRVLPLYTEAKSHATEPRLAPFRVCMRHREQDPPDTLREDVEGGADALWMPRSAMSSVSADVRARTFFVLSGNGELPDVMGLAIDSDPLGDRASGAPFATLDDDLARLGRDGAALATSYPSATAAMISTLPYHDAGGDAVDEIAFALSTGALYLRHVSARQLAVRIALGRDTFLELAKVRALRRCWRKLLVASGAADAPAVLVHGVCSSRTLTVRDPWVNMLRVTTQVFAGVLGGVDLVTPCAFDDAFGAASALGRRVARNTGLVLREESALGKVVDPAGGAYFFETVSDELARKSWDAFRGIEGSGGIRKLLESGQIATDLAEKWNDRLAQIARRKIPLLGTSEFAALDEKLPHPLPDPPPKTAGLAAHRDSEAFEALRARGAGAEVLLLTLGPLAESRPRAGFASNFFSAGGLRSRETSNVETSRIVCICGSDERYAAEAVRSARALKEAGCDRILLAGKPGPLESELRAAGVSGFIFVGCDVVATLSSLGDAP